MSELTEIAATPGPGTDTSGNGAPAAATERLRSLEEVLAEVNDLEIQMLLIEVGSINEHADFDLINRAYGWASDKHAGQTRMSGRPFMQHCVEVARILAQLRLDSTTVAAGLLHDVLEDTSVTLEEVAAEFSPKIAALTDGVTKVERFQYRGTKDQDTEDQDKRKREAEQAENFRKLLLSMVEDLRVILIKFADRLHNMRTLDHVDPEQQKRISRETVDVYAPLAYRLGLARISRELEDLSLKYLDADQYDEIRRQVAMKREQREVYIEEFKAPIQTDLAKAGIDAEITGRPKHFYSIYNKMKSQGTTFEEIYDLSGVRILVESVRDCYTTLGLVHSLYLPISDRFKDYIATPKTNMYQSLHTSVVGPDGNPVEVQIRTREMHQTAEIGIAAHWRYKSGGSPEVESDQRIGWLRQVLDHQREAADPMEFLENLKIELYRDEIYVFTPEGDLEQLPRGATTLDFAFAVHTDIGLHCLTAKVNGQIVPLGTQLQSGDSVQIIDSQHQHPTSSWLDMVKTGKARYWIGRWLREEQFSHGVRLGQEILERELEKYRHSVRSESLDELAEELGLADSEHLYAAVGSGELSVSGVVNRLVPERPKRRIRPLFRNLRGIRIQGLDNMMIHFGKCCSPIPGDRIVGLITKGRGITVHRTDCPNMGDIAEDPDRVTVMEWDVDEEQSFSVQLRVTGTDRTYLLTEMTRVISEAGANIRSAESHTRLNRVEGTFQLDVTDARQLRAMIGGLAKIEGVNEVTRVDDPDLPPA